MEEFNHCENALDKKSLGTNHDEEGGYKID